MQREPWGSAPSPLVADRLIDMLAELVNRPAWQADALCREYPDIDFVPPRGADTSRAKNICGGCLVQAECFEAGSASGEYGVWGGTDEIGRGTRSVDDLCSRQRSVILDGLAALGGTVTCDKGGASRGLRETLALEVPLSTFNLRLNELENDGLIVRTVHVRRTYSIALTPEGAM